MSKNLMKWLETGDFTIEINNKEFSGRKILCAIFVAKDSIGEFTCYVT